VRQCLTDDDDVVTGLAADASFMYWTTADGFVRKESNGAMTMSARKPALSRGIALRNGNVYFTAATDGSVNRVGRTGGPISVLVQNLSVPLSLVTDDTSVYFDVEPGEPFSGKILKTAL
jgi:hypothetical protein